jgi:hypothetical protein
VLLRGSTVIPYCLNWADQRQFRHLSFSAQRGLDDCEQRARKALRDNPAEVVKLDLRMKHTREFIFHYNPV